MSRPYLILLLSLVLPFGACAQESQFQEGTHYLLVQPAQPVTTNKIQVLEFFSYGCQHCFTFEPYFKKWRATVSASVEVKQVPSVMNQGGMILAKAFYAAQDLGVFDAVHAALFKAIQVDRKPVSTEEQIGALVKGLGIDEAKFLDSMRSFQVDAKVRDAMQTIRRYRVSGVPAVAVNGKYLTGGGMAGSYVEITEILDYLVAKEITAAKTKSTASAQSSAAAVN